MNLSVLTRVSFLFMTHDEKLQAIREKIVEARDGCLHDVEYGDGKLFQAICPKCSRVVARYPAIGLCDVLLALSPREYDKNVNCEQCGAGASEGDKLNVLSYWNLRSDSLEEQKEETTIFLFDLLCPK